MNDELERLAALRTARHVRIAAVIVERLADGLAAGEAEPLIARLLTEAYEDGRRDMYALVDEHLKPLWQVAGLEP